MSRPPNSVTNLPDPWVAALEEGKLREPVENSGEMPYVRQAVRPKAVRTAETAVRTAVRQYGSTASRQRESIEGKDKVTVRLPRQLIEHAKLYCLMNGITLQQAIEEGLWAKCRTYGSTASRTYGNSSHDHDDHDDDDKNIINLFRRRTGRKWNGKDQALLDELRETYPQHVIKAGIIVTSIRAKDPIGSFAYCVGAIEEMARKGATPEYVEHSLERIVREEMQIQEEQ